MKAFCYVYIMCTMRVFLRLVRMLDIWQLEGRSGAQAAARLILHTYIVYLLLLHENFPHHHILNKLFVRPYG